jgi:hypothetical protein
MKKAGNGFGITIAGFALGIAGDCAATLAALDSYLLPWLPREPLVNPATVIRIVRVGEPPRFEILVQGAVVETAFDVPGVVVATQRVVDEAVIRRLSGFAIVHAGVVAHAGIAILLPGSSRCGKSTLVAELVRRGAVYFSDEYALVDAGGWVHAYPRALMLRDGSPGQRPFLPSELGAKVAEAPLRAGLILALRYAGQEACNLENMSHGEALLLLLRNTPQVLEESPQILSHLRQALAGAVCYSGVRGDAGAAADRILRMAEARSSLALP